MTTPGNSEFMLFNYETTYKSDFRDGEISPLIKTKYREKPICLMVRPPPLKDVHTLTQWQERIPFGLLHKPKEIVNTDPRKIQQPYSKLDLEPSRELRKEVRKTRPRLVMTPAVSMDDIEERARNILIKDFYTSDMKRGTREAVSDYFSVRAPLPGPMAPSNPITLPKLQTRYVSPEWRMESVPWDNKQLRGYCDSDRQFWLAHPPVKCEGCEEFNAGIAHRRMMERMK